MINYRERSRRRRSAFTMIELMIVVIIVAILAAAATPLYQGATRKAYRAEIGGVLGHVRGAQRKYRTVHGVYTATMSDLTGEQFISADDFADMGHVTGDVLGNITLVVPEGGATFTATLDLTEVGDNLGDKAGAARARIDQAGVITFFDPD